MNKALKIILIIVGIIVIAIAAMAVFKICPPSGPWPTPPWCSANKSSRVSYDVTTSPSHITQIKAVNMYDTWGRNYNMGMFETTQANISSSFDRVAELGASEVYVHDFDRAIFDKGSDYTTTNYKFADEIFWNDFRDQSISKNEIKKLADEAHSRGLKLGIKRNTHFVNIGKYITAGISGNISESVNEDVKRFNQSHSPEWITDFFAKWQARLIAKADIYNAAGVDIMSVSPFFMDPQFKGNEELANTQWKQLIGNLRSQFDGQIECDINVYGLTDGTNDGEDWSKYDYYKDADIAEVRVYKILEKFQNGSPKIRENMAGEIKETIKDINSKAGLQGKKLSIFFAPSSYTNGLFAGPLEFLDINNSAVKSAQVDYSEQSEAFEAMLQSLSSAVNIERINVGNFTWDDKIDPEVKPRVSISASFRNKPAEEVIKSWFNK